MTELDSGHSTESLAALALHKQVTRVFSARQAVLLERTLMPFQNVRWYRFDAVDLPALGGVYGILDHNRTVVYIGQTDDLRRRIGEHRGDRSHCMHRHLPVWIVFEYVPAERERLIRERVLIAEFNPPCNKT